MTSRIIPLFAYLVLVGFLGILVWKLQRLDLTVLVLITLALAGWDFFRPEKK